MTRIFQGILPIILGCASVCLANLEVVHEWKYIDYDWESDDQKAEAVEAGVYDSTKIITHDFQPLLDGRMVVTTPKRYNNPASLSTVSNKTCDGGPLLAPYPDWSWHTKTDCSGITSVSRVFLDDCNRLWLVDSGKIEKEQLCPAKILVFDAASDELLKEIEIPTDLSHSPNDSSLGELELHHVQTSEEDSCGSISVFIYDLEGHGLIIYDGSDMWRLNDAFFTPPYDVYDFYVGEERVIMESGPVVILLLSAEYFEEDYILFRNLLGPYNYVASLKEILNSKSGTEVQWWTSDLVMDVPEPAKVISKIGGVLFSNFPISLKYGCWNIVKPLNMDNVGIAETNNTTLQYTSSAKTVVNPDGVSELVYVSTNRLQKFVNGIMDFTETNFRIMATDIGSYVAGTVCAAANQTIATSIEEHEFSRM